MKSFNINKGGNWRSFYSIFWYRSYDRDNQRSFYSIL